MSSRFPEISLDLLRAGDEQTMADLLHAYEPLVRLMVRRSLPNGMRTRLDSTDIIHSVWVRVLRSLRTAGWRFEEPDQFEAFLLKVIRNRMIDQVRQHQTSRNHEQPLSANALQALVPSPQPRPSQQAQAGDLWERLVALCPPTHRELLDLKRQGLSLAEIASHTGLHPSSVRRILYDLARKLALDAPERHLS